MGECSGLHPDTVKERTPRTASSMFGTPPRKILLTLNAGLEEWCKHGET